MIYEYTITKNENADIEYFNFWMLDNYINYDGYAQNDVAFIAVYNKDVDFTEAEKTEISNFYSGLTTESIHDVQCRIFDYVADVELQEVLTEPPFQIDYIRELNQRLNPIITDVYKGEVREITYYESVTLNPDGSQTGITEVIRESFVYVRDASLLPIYRTMKIYWTLENGDEHFTFKQRVKYYTSEQKIAEGQKRRRNIIDFMQIPVIGMLVVTEGLTTDEAITLGAEFFDSHTVDVSSYIYTPRTGALQDAIAVDTTDWLDNVVNIPESGDTIKDYMLDQLNY